MSRYNEKRVRRAYDEIVFKWDSADVHGEEYETFLMVLHEDDGYGIDDIIDDNLEEALLDEMTDEDREEVVRRLRVKYPEEILRRIWRQQDEENREEEEEDEEEEDEDKKWAAWVDSWHRDETPAQFEARRATIWRTFEQFMSPREIRALVWNTRR